MLKVVTIAAFVLFALLSAFLTYILVIVLREAAIDDSVVPWPSLLIYAAVVGVTVALWFAMRRVTAPLTPERLFAQLAKRQKRSLIARVRGEYLPVALQTETIQTMLNRGSRAVATLGRGADYGFGGLAAEAEAATARADPEAFLYWRDLGVIASGLDDDRAIAALLRANELSSNDFLTIFFLHNRYLESKKLEEARRVAEIGEALAKTDLQRALLLQNVATASALNFDFRGAAIAAEKATALARSADPKLLEVLEGAATGLGLQTATVMKDVDFATARWLMTAYVELRRVLAERLGTAEARNEFADALIRCGGYLVKRGNTDEGHAMIAEGEKLGDKRPASAAGQGAGRPPAA